MKLKYFYLIIVPATIGVAMLMEVMEGSFNVFAILGCALAIFFMPALILAISGFSVWLRKKRELTLGEHMSVFLVAWLFMVCANITGTLYETQNPSQLNSTSDFADSLFTAEGCEYSVIFPGKPKYINAFHPDIGDYIDYIQAEYTNNRTGIFLRAECIVVGDIRAAEMSNKEFLQKLTVAYAVSNGLQNCGYNYGEGSLGKYAHVRGFKTISGIPVTFEGYIYVGNKSFITLLAGGASATYPQPDVYEFFQSLRRK